MEEKEPNETPDTLPEPPPNALVMRIKIDKIETDEPPAPKPEKLH